MTSLRRVVPLLFLLLLATPASSRAQPYSARREGDVVRLEDTKTQTLVSILPAVGNLVFEVSLLDMIKR